MPWIADGILESERGAAQELVDLVASHGPVFDVVVSKAWVADGLDETERSVLESLGRIAEANQDAAGRVAAMPLLETIELADDDNLRTLSGLTHSRAFFRRVVRAAWVADGLDETETFIITHFGRPAFVDNAEAATWDIMDGLLREDWTQDGLDETEAFIIERVERLRSLRSADDEESAPAVLHFLNALLNEAWVRDGLDEAERFIIRSRLMLPDDKEATAAALLGVNTLLNEAWVQDGLDETERSAINRIVTALRLADRRAPSAHAVSGLAPKAWVQDGLDETEHFVIQSVARAADDEEAAAAIVRVIDGLVSEAWVQDGLDEPERLIIARLRWLRFVEEEAAAATLHIVNGLVSEAWVRDGLDETEFSIIESLGSLRSVDDEEAAAAVVHFVSLLLSEAWVRDGLDEAERFIIESRRRAPNDEEAAAGVLRVINALVAEAWVQDGLDETERLIIRGFVGGLGHDEAATAVLRLIDTLVNEAQTLGGLDETTTLVLEHLARIGGDADLRGLIGHPWQVSKEERLIDLPLAGEVLLTIIRTRPGAARSMDSLEHSVRGVEALMSEPLPTSYVRVLFSFGGPAAHFGEYIALPAGVDDEEGSSGADWFDGAILHELTHYYWGSSSGWMNEGVASIVEDIVDEARDGKPVDADNHPCAHVRSIEELEAIPFSFYDCNYTLGKRIFLDLYRSLGVAAFQQGLRDLYLMAKRGDVGISSLEAAFKAAAPDRAAVVDTAIARWYYGTEPYVDPPPDGETADSELPGVGGRIEAAFVVSVDGRRVSSFSAQDPVLDPELAVQLSFRASRTSREVRLQAVGYYEDGYSFGRRYAEFTVEPGQTEHTVNVWFDRPGPGYGWATGRYWVYVYYEGRKAAEASFEVTP